MCTLPRCSDITKNVSRATSMAHLNIEHYIKGVHPPKKNEKKGDTAFSRRRRPCSPSNRLQVKICSVWRAPCTPLNHSEFFFVGVQRVNESDQKSGVSKYPFLACVREGIPRRLYYVLEVPLFGTILPLFGTSRIGVPRTGSKTPPVGDCSSSWLLWHDEKTTPHVETTNGPDPLKRDQHT